MPFYALSVSIKAAEVILKETVITGHSAPWNAKQNQGRLRPSYLKWWWWWSVMTAEGSVSRLHLCCIWTCWIFSGNPQCAGRSHICAVFGHITLYQDYKGSMGNWGLIWREGCYILENSRTMMFGWKWHLGNSSMVVQLDMSWGIHISQNVIIKWLSCSLCTIWSWYLTKDSHVTIHMACHWMNQIQLSESIST